LCDFNKQIHEAIEALPFQEPLVLLFESGCPAVGVAWAVRPRLAGIFVLNFTGYFDEDYENSMAHAKGRALSLSVGKAMREGNLHVVENFAGAMLYVDDASAMVDFKRRLLEEVRTANKSYGYGAMGATLHEYHTRDVSEDMRGREPLEPVPAALCCGAYSMGTAVQVSMRLLQKKLPGAGLSYIPKSKILWGLEGAAQADLVAD